jgi:uncharacterized protein YktA (UPF0223 family)
MNMDTNKVIIKGPAKERILKRYNRFKKGVFAKVEELIEIMLPAAF